MPEDNTNIPQGDQSPSTDPSPALLSAIKPGDDVKMINPNGERLIVDGQNVKDALDNGWTIHPEAKLDIAKKREVDLRNDNPNYQGDSLKDVIARAVTPGSDINNWADMVLDNFTFGIKPAAERIYHHYADTTDEEKRQTELANAKMEATENEYPITSTVAKTAGFLGSLPLTAPVKSAGMVRNVIEGGSAATRELAGGAAGGAAASEPLGWAANRAVMNEIAGNIRATGIDVGKMGATDLGIRGVEEGAEESLSKKGAVTIADIANNAIKENAEQSFSKQVAASVLKNAAISEAFSAPSQIADYITGDKEKASESILWSLGLGATLGLGGSLTSAAVSKFGSLMEGLSPKLTDALDNMKLSQAGLKAEKSGKVADKILNFLEEKEMSGNVITDEQKQIWKKELGAEFGKYRDDVQRDIFNKSQIPTAPNVNPINIFDTKTKQLQELVNTHPDLAYQKPGQFHEVGIKPVEFAESLKNSFEQDHPGIYNNPLHKTETNTLNDIISNFESKGNASLSFKDTGELENNLKNVGIKGSKTIWSKNNLESQVDTASNQVKQWAEQKLSAARDAEVQKMLIGSGKPADISKYSKLLQDYSAVNSMLDPKLLEKDKGLIPSGLTTNSAILTSAGSLLSGHPSGLLGAAGLIAKPLITQIGKRAALPYAIRGLSSIAENPEMFGPNLANHLSQMADKHFSDSAKFVIGTSKIAPYRLSASAYDTFLGKSGENLSTDQKYNKVSNTLTNAIANPDLIASKVGSISSIFGLSPALKSLVANKQLDTINFLYQHLPKNPNPNKPFSKNDWTPSAQEKQKFERILAVVENPGVIVHKLASPNTSLSNDEIMTMKTIYPKLYQKLAGEIIKESYFPAASKVPLTTRNKLDNFTGGGIEPSLSAVHLQRTQNTYSQPMPQSNPAGSAPEPKHTNKSLKNGPGESLLTATQRRSNK